jgi:hypothetical protein
MTDASICEGLRRRGSGDWRLFGFRKFFLVYDPYVYRLLVADAMRVDQ